MLIFLPFYLFIFFSSASSDPDAYKIKLSLIFYLGFSLLHPITTILNLKNFHYSIGENFLTLRQGILSKEQRNIPYGVIQNIFQKQDLLDRIFGLASLTIENSSHGQMSVQYQKKSEVIGFSGNKVTIPGLTKANAEILKGIVLSRMKANPLEDSQSGL